MPAEGWPGAAERAAAAALSKVHGCEFDLHQTKNRSCNFDPQERNSNRSLQGCCVSFLFQSRIRGPMLRLDPTAPSNGPGLARRQHLRRHRSLCAPGSSPGKIPDDHRAAQMALLLAGRNPNKSQVFLWPERNGSRSPPGLASLPAGKSCNASGSNNHVPGRTPDQQR
jgi:hypothetical protein